ncbi:PAS domain-containing sensor histidine kinase [Alkalihalobacterium elongatum]|uniref:PAS domain-containing sensor histidine kinase n=1 Tax=Alkalihalobacterium elongatum TaxID=2675466 RepID=UPI001C1F4217|nr:PAS domain-containing sensor histidine kinase [Alkalihalobacterium elongatum]
MNITQLDTFDILDKITDGFYALDSNWNFIYLNSEAEKILNRSKEKLLGKCVWDEFADAIDLPMYTHYLSAMESQQSVNFDFYYPSMKQWFDVRAYPSSEGLSVYFLDITDLKRKNIQRDQHYQSLFTNNLDAVYSFDLAGRYMSVNKALEKLSGYSEEDLVNQSFYSFVVEEDIQKAIYYFGEAVRGTPQTFNCKVNHKNGRVIHCKMTNIPITVEDKITGIYGICKDITLQKAAEESIEKAEKLSLVGQLSASIAHEIRNPLTTLKGFLQLIQAQEEINPVHIEILLSEMERIELITSELLLLAKPQAVELGEENIKETLNDVITLLQSQALMKNIDIVFEYDHVDAISCVNNQVKQVFINLIKNAIEAMSDGGVIKVVLFDFSQDTVLIEIVDQGCGISKELAPNIGLPFYSTKEKGTGLGMVTTYKIINDHGGKIDFESTSGEGTTFRVYLPKKMEKVMN